MAVRFRPRLELLETRCLLAAVTPTITTTASPTSIAAGSTTTLSDTASLAGGSSPTGTVQFALLGPTSSVVDQVTGTVTATTSGHTTTYTATSASVSAPTTAGTYQWIATYLGDANNNPVTGAPESITVTPSPPITPTLTNEPSATTSPVGTNLTDTVTFSGGLSPTGNVVFTLTGPTGSVVDQETSTVSSNTATTPTGYVPTVLGTYEWSAAYSGDSNNLPTSVGPTPVTVTQASPTLTTTASASAVTLGTKLTDTATLTEGNNPTGTVLFILTGPSGLVNSQVATLTASTTSTTTSSTTTSSTTTYSATTPNGFTPTTPGVYTWTASYEGDADNASVNASGEFITVTFAQPTLTVTPGPPVLFGTGAVLSASATLAGGVSPTGLLTFELDSPSLTTIDTQVVAVSGNGTYKAPHGFLPTTAGTYTWLVAYTGDNTRNAPVSLTSGKSSGTISEVVALTTPTLVSEPGPSVNIGGHGGFSDSATLAGALKPTGSSITFTLTGPNGQTVDTVTKNVNGNGVYTTGKLSTTGDSVGIYVWEASYSGNSDNNSVTAAVVAQQLLLASPTLTSRTGGTISLGSGGKLTDTITVTGGANPTGTITFYLFAPGTAIDVNGAGAVYTSGPITLSKSKTTYSAGSYLPAVQGNYEWLAVYSGDSNNSSETSAVVEAVEVLRWGRA